MFYSCLWTLQFLWTLCELLFRRQISFLLTNHLIQLFFFYINMICLPLEISFHRITTLLFIPRKCSCKMPNFVTCFHPLQFLFPLDFSTQHAGFEISIIFSLHYTTYSCTAELNRIYDGFQRFFFLSLVCFAVDNPLEILKTSNFVFFTIELWTIHVPLFFTPFWMNYFT